MNLMSKRIFEQRKKLDYTMEELAEKVGVTKSTVNKWEKGMIENIKRSTIKELAKVLECDPVWLMGMDDNEEENYYLNDATRDMAQFLFDNPAYKVLFDASRKTKPEDIEKVAQMIQLMNGDD